MDGGHLHTVISSFPEIFVEGPLARSMLVSHPVLFATSLFALHVVLPFVCVL